MTRKDIGIKRKTKTTTKTPDNNQRYLAHIPCLFGVFYNFNESANFVYTQNVGGSSPSPPTTLFTPFLLIKPNKNGVFRLYDRPMHPPCYNLKQVEIRGSKTKTKAKTRQGAKTLKRLSRLGF